MLDRQDECELYISRILSYLFIFLQIDYIELLFTVLLSGVAFVTETHRVCFYRKPKSSSSYII